MKKVLLVISIVISLKSVAQSFYKNALVVDATIGIDGYSVKEHQVNKFNNSTIDKTDGAASHNLGFGAEYGVADWLGLGARIKSDNYFTSKDTVTKTTPSASGLEIGAIINFHMVRAKHFNFSGGFNLGYSSLTYKANNPSNLEAYGSGSWVDIHITPRVYFGRFGICLTMYVPFINYPSLTTNVPNYNQYVLNSWKATGFGMNFGIQYRFLSN